MTLYRTNRKIKRVLGFTLVEVVIVGSLISTMFLLATRSLFHGNKTASLDQTSSGLVRDLREQQIKAMQGVVQISGVAVDYSVLFEPDRYILYPGTVYDSLNTQNQVVTLDPSMRFSVIGLPENIITFARGSGGVRGYISGADFFVLTETALGNALTIRVNEAGVIFVSK